NTFLYEAEQEYKRKLKAEEFGLPFKQKTMNQIVSQVTAFSKQPEDRKWLRKYPAWTIQKAADHAKQSYRDWWSKKSSKPRYKKKGLSTGSARVEKPKTGYKIERLNRNNSRVWLSKLGWVKFKDSRPDLPLNATGVTLVRESTVKYYISFVVQQP